MTNEYGFPPNIKEDIKTLFNRMYRDIAEQITTQDVREEMRLDAIINL